MGALIGSIEMIINNIRRKGIAYISKHHPSAKLKAANVYRVSSTDTIPGHLQSASVRPQQAADATL